MTVGELRRMLDSMPDNFLVLTESELGDGGYVNARVRGLGVVGPIKPEGYWDYEYRSPRYSERAKSVTACVVVERDLIRMRR